MSQLEDGSRHSRIASVTGSLLRRNLRVLVIHPNDSDGAVLTEHLQRMGFNVQAFWPVPTVRPDNVELIFLAMHPEQRDPHAHWEKTNHIPIISVIAFENPTFIDHALEIGATAVITTPIRVSGLLSTVVMAMQLYKKNKQLADRVERLEHKVVSTRQVGEAQTILMKMHSINESQAYEILRTQAMAKRLPIETICQSVIQANDVFSMTAPKKALGAD